MISAPLTTAPLATPETDTAGPPAGGPQGGNVHQEKLTQFLTLLTTQIENQDPLEPLDSTGFVEQLATFSALEQQVQSNTYLEEILAALRG